MQNVGVSVQGAGRLRATLRKAGHDLADLKAAHAAAALIAQHAATGLTPVLTGKLRASVRSSGTKTAAVLRAGGAAVPYAAPIHWGWPRRGIAPSLFLSRGAQDSETQWLPVYQAAVDHALDQIKGN